MTGTSWLIKHVRTTSTDSSLERLAARGTEPGTVVISVQPSGRTSRPKLLRMGIILRPKRTSRLEMLPMIGAFAIAHGVRKATGVVCSIRSPGEAVIDDRIVGNAFTKVNKVGGADSFVILNLKVKCTIWSDQLGDLLANSPWPKNTLFLDPDVLIGKILEAFDWIYSEWEMGMDRTLESRIRPISSDFFP